MTWWQREHGWRRVAWTTTDPPFTVMEEDGFRSRVINKVEVSEKKMEQWDLSEEDEVIVAVLDGVRRRRQLGSDGGEEWAEQPTMVSLIRGETEREVDLQIRNEMKWGERGWKRRKVIWRRKRKWADVAEFYWLTGQTGHNALDLSFFLC